MGLQPLQNLGQVAGVLVLSLLPLRSDGHQPPRPIRRLPAVQHDPRQSPQRPAKQDSPVPARSAAFARDLGADFEELPGEGEPPQSSLEQSPPDDEATEEEDAAEDDEASDEVATLLARPWHEFGCIRGEYCYTGEVFNNTRGGISTKDATRYGGCFDLVLQMDTAAAGWWDNGQFYVYMQQSQGTTLTSEFVGDGQFYSDIDTSPKHEGLTQLGEYWYQHTFGEDELTVRIGRQDPNCDFAYADYSCDFINSSFATLPNIPMPYWPFQTVGLSTLYSPNPQWRLGGGCYDHGSDQGQWWTTTTSRGMFFIAQADYMPNAECENAPSTTLRAGSWYTSSDTAAVDGAGSFDGNFGVYTTVDRMLIPECHAADQGLAGFFQYCWAPDDRNQVQHGIGAGLVYTGWYYGHDQDTCGLAFTLIQFSPELRQTTGQTNENAIEVFYKACLCDWLALTTDLQYIARPSGIYNDAMVVGLRFEITL
jgi:porin